MLLVMEREDVEHLVALLIWHVWDKRVVETLQQFLDRDAEVTANG